MHISSIKQNAQSIIDAYEVYFKVALAPNQDKVQIKKLKNYILNLAQDISKKSKEMNLDVN